LKVGKKYWKGFFFLLLYLLSYRYLLCCCFYFCWIRYCTKVANMRENRTHTRSLTQPPKLLYIPKIQLNNLYILKKECAAASFFFRFSITQFLIIIIIKSVNKFLPSSLTQNHKLHIFIKKENIFFAIQKIKKKVN
jgi:hypothetical protein